MTTIIRVVEKKAQFRPADEWAVSFCREVRVVYVRPNGNIQRMLMTRLSEAMDERRCLIYSPSDRAIPRHLRDLVDRGAILCRTAAPKRSAQTPRPVRLDVQSRRTRVQSLNDFRFADFVAHFTRRQTGAWLDQAESEYLDSLLLGKHSDQRGPLAALKRILVQQQLIANNRLTRDASRVVCFTGRPLDEFARLRKFRSHLARWDFEPYGIAVRRAALVRLGGRRVQYGDEQTWAQTATADRPFFQIAGATTVDWTVEDEWRVLGDIDLCKLAVDDAIVFVARPDEADGLAALSRWPIVALHGPKQSKA
jgi:hypothetical protein